MVKNHKAQIKRKTGQSENGVWQRVGTEHKKGQKRYIIFLNISGYRSLLARQGEGVYLLDPVRGREALGIWATMGNCVPCKNGHLLGGLTATWAIPSNPIQ